MAGGRKQTTQPRKFGFNWNYHGKPSGRGKVSENQKAKTDASTKPKRKVQTSPAIKVTSKVPESPRYRPPTTRVKGGKGVVLKPKAASTSSSSAPRGTTPSSSRPQPSGRPPLKAGQKAPAPKRAMPKDSEKAKGIITGSKAANKMANAKFNAAKNKSKNNMQKRSAAGRKAFGIGV